MSIIGSMIAKETHSWVEFPGLDDFEVNLNYLNRDELSKIRNSCITFTFNKHSKVLEESIDQDKFLAKYAEKAIVGWRGLKIKHLPELFPVDIRDANHEEEVVFTVEDAVALLQNSTIFDQFITDTMSDIEQFSKTKADEDVKN